jgi:predicted PurR-regulated permease PerM
MKTALIIFAIVVIIFAVFAYFVKMMIDQAVEMPEDFDEDSSEEFEHDPKAVF